MSELGAFRDGMLLDERASVFRKAANRSPRGATFLSHSTLDVGYLPAVVRLLENHGASVYLDENDELLPPYTSAETASILRAWIVASHNFVLFATKASRWIPRELGVSDGLDREHTVVLSGLDTLQDTDWAEREYIGVYDRIVHGALQGYEGKVWMVWNRQDNTGKELTAWLAA